MKITIRPFYHAFGRWIEPYSCTMGSGCRCEDRSCRGNWKVFYVPSKAKFDAMIKGNEPIWGPRIDREFGDLDAGDMFIAYRPNGKVIGKWVWSGEHYKQVLEGSDIVIRDFRARGKLRLIQGGAAMPMEPDEPEAA